MNFRRCTQIVRPLVLTWVALCSVATVSVADESNDWLLGRVFMTRAERLQLDELRNTLHSTASVSTTNNDSSVVVSTSVRDVKASGYILSSNGSPYRWENGDFQKTSRKEIVAALENRDFEIIKHHPAPIPDSVLDTSAVDAADAEQTSDDVSEQ